MNPTILAAGIIPTTSFSIGGSSQQITYSIGVNPVTVPQDTQHVLKLILQILSPSGTVIYQNSGWNSSNFASPDSLTGAYNLPLLSGQSVPESGIYQINIQAQYTDTSGGSPGVVTNATVNYTSAKICVSCLPTPALTFPVDCTNVLLTITDVTNYALQGFAFTSVSRTITAVPPAGSNQPSPTTTNKVLQIDNGNEGNGILYNGTYLLSLAATATYQLGSTTIVQTLAYTTPASGPSACLVSCLDVRCQLYCALGQLNETYQGLLTTNNSTLAASYLTRLMAGNAFLSMINAAIECGDDYSQFITQFWTACGLDPGCSTCLQETATGPVTPTGCGCGGSSGGSQGQAGTPGSIWRTGSGAPSNTLGVNTDLYLDTATGNVYQKSSNVYSLVCNIIGPEGATGATGPAGSSGATELWEQVINYSNSGAGASDIQQFSIPTTAIQSLGDAVHIQTEVTTPTDASKVVKFEITLGSTTYSLPATVFSQTSSPNVTYAIVKFRFYLTENTGVFYLNVRIDVNYEALGIYGIANDLPSFKRTNIQIGAYTLGNPLTFTVDFSSCTTAGSANLLICEGINYKKA